MTGPAMTRRQMARYVCQLGALMGLKDWDLRVSDEPPDSAGAYASVSCVAGRRIAWVRVSAALLAEDPAERRYAVCHELLHVHHALADRIAESHMPESVHGAWTAAMEHAIDGVARDYARLLPLPS